MDFLPQNHESTPNANKSEADPYCKAKQDQTPTLNKSGLKKSDTVEQDKRLQSRTKAHGPLSEVVTECRADGIYTQALETVPSRQVHTAFVTNHNRPKSNAKDRASQSVIDEAKPGSREFSTSAPLRTQRSTSSATIECKFGWICALPFEAAAAETMLDEQYPDLPLDTHGSTLYTLGRVGPHNVVIACLPRGRPGLSAAAVVAKGMLERFRSIKFGFMVGIGGGVPSDRDDIRLGDVVVSQPNLEHGGVVQYDFGKAEEGGMFRRTGHLNSPPALLLSVLNRVQTNHELGRRTYPIHMSLYAVEGMEGYTLPQNEQDTLFVASYSHPAGTLDCTGCDLKQAINRRDRNTKQTTVKIHYGTIASGNQVIKDAQTRDRIVKDLGGQVLCFEMEAAGLMNDFPCLVVRGISDYCDSHKNDGWQRYAAASAAAYTRELLLSIPPEDVVE
jgi:nucleoside phosphorylase